MQREAQNNLNRKAHMQFRTIQSSRPKVVSPAYGLSQTVQSAEAECNITTLTRKYRRTGTFPNLPSSSRGQYLDTTIISGDAVQYFDTVRRIEEAFSSLPAQLRLELGNNPRNFIPWLQNPENRKKAEQFGILKPVPGQSAEGTLNASGVPAPKAPQGSGEQPEAKK